MHPFVSSLFRSLVVTLPLATAGCGVQEVEQPLGDVSATHAGSDSGHGTDGGASHGGQVNVSAKSTSEWVYFSLVTGKVVQVADSATSLAWDLRLRRTQIGTNSGKSGSGKGGALATGKKADPEVNKCPTDGYQVDADLPLPGPPGAGTFAGSPVLSNWYDYDPATHATTTRGEVYCVRDAAGRYGSLRIVAYASGDYTLSFRHQHDGSPVLP